MKAISQLILRVLLAGVLVATVAYAQQDTTTAIPSAPVIVAVGVGELRVAPDHAVIWFAVETHGFDPTRIGQENAGRVSTLRQALEQQSISSADMQTTGYTFGDDFRYRERDPKEPNRYVARNGLRVIVKNLDRLGVVIDTAIGSGANRVDRVAFQVSEESKIRRKATALAVEDARARAEAMASAAGGKLGEVIEIASASALSRGPFDFVRKPVPGTDITRTEITITEQVIAKWRLLMDSQ